MTQRAPVGIAVDFGTTNTCVAILKNGKPEVIGVDLQNRTFPTTVGVVKSDWRIGRYEATDSLGDNLLVPYVKRVAGRDYRDPQLKEDIEKWHLPFVKNDRGRPVCFVNGAEVIPEEFMALILLYCVELAESYTGQKVESAVIAVPAYFNHHQRQAVHYAAAIADLKVHRLINEATAVALAYTYDKPEDDDDDHKDGRVVVCDLGGGTFDVAIVYVNRQERSFHVEATAGNNRLGGEDCTRALAQSVLATGMIPSNVSPEAIDRALIPACEKAKRKQTNQDEPMEVDVAGHLCTVSQAEYKRALKDVVAELRRVIRQACGITTKASITSCVLAGGGSYLKWVDQVCREELRGIDIMPRRELDTVVAKGAALALKPLSELYIVDVLTNNLGIDTQNVETGTTDRMEVLIRKNSPLPASRTKPFLGVHDETLITVLQGDSDQSSKNIRLVEFKIPVAAGEEFELSITANEDGTVTVLVNTKDKTIERKVEREEYKLTSEEIEILRNKTQERFRTSSTAQPQEKPKRTGKKRKRRIAL